jgi:hypothetical protein
VHQLTIRTRRRNDPHARDRAIMVERHLEARGIADPLVPAAMGGVPREKETARFMTCPFLADVC